MSQTQATNMNPTNQLTRPGPMFFAVRSGQHLTSLAVSIALGLAVGVLSHYILYRLSLPAKPFIYAAF